MAARALALRDVLSRSRGVEDCRCVFSGGGAEWEQDCCECGGSLRMGGCAAVVLLFSDEWDGG
jgi:hypothetical protein